jgi:iron complex transport system substrate-binding protein
LVATQGDRRNLRGITSSDNYPANLNVPVVASVKPDFEKIATIKPDLIVLDSSLYNQQDIEKLKGLGADTFVIDANTVDGLVDQLLKLGSALGSETNVSSYVDRIQAAQSAAKGNPFAHAPKVAVLMSGAGSGEHMIAGTKSFVADAVKVSGGIPIGPESDKFEKLSPEFLVGQNPDLIVVAATTSGAAQQLASVKGDPRFGSVKAIKNDAVVPLNQDVVVRRGSRVDKLIDALHGQFAKAVAK